ncbi:MAG TPA: FMN-binding negative transcriptional regulator [Polyangia bacterium]|nr:FMN-binding negative transcriptional regulator [Polyangia bacterium]
MYLPAAFRLDDEATIEGFIGQYDFATIVSTPPSGPIVTHAPLIARRAPDGRLVLVGHVARDNDHWRTMDGATPAVAIFHGPQGYISPIWYASAPAVPTWNYAVVHAHGNPFAHDEDDFTEAAISALVDKYENGPGAWRVESMPPDFYAGLLTSIVGFEMPIERIEAKFKLGQNRSDADRAGAIANLERQALPGISALADLMRRALDNRD